MIKIIWFVFEITINLFESIIFTDFIFKTLLFKKSKRNKVINCVICTSLLFISCTVFNHFTFFEGIGIFVYFLIMLAFSVVYFEDNIFKKVLVSLLPISFLAIASTLSTNVCSTMFQITIPKLMSEQNIFRLFTVIFGNLVLFILLYIAKILITKNDLLLTKAEWIYMGSMLIISITVFMLLYFAIFESISDTPKILIFISIFGIIAINISIYILLIQLSKKQRVVLENNLLKQAYTYQNDSAKILKQQYDQVHKMRHDFKNTLLIIQNLNQENNRIGIDDYISKYIDQSKNIIKLVNTNNDYFNAIINAKIAQAKEFDINVTFNIFSDISQFDQLDICSMLSNMFDNAIEACQKCLNNRQIHIEIQKDKMSIIFFMKNSINASILSQNPNLQTDKTDTNIHGYGTKIIKAIANKYHGYVDYYEENKMFCCNVILNTN